MHWSEWSFTVWQTQVVRQRTADLDCQSTLVCGWPRWKVLSTESGGLGPAVEMALRAFDAEYWSTAKALNRRRLTRERKQGEPRVSGAFS
jgi:hypothetical protein